MAASYPSSAKSFTPIVDGVDYPQAAQVNQVYDEVTSVEQALINGLAHDLKFTDATYDVGKSGATRPRDLFLSRNATIGGTLAVTGAVSPAAGVAFPATQAASADANTLDDYEEGTWTPVIGGDGGTSGQTYTTQVGSYIKIGKHVTVQCTVTLSVKGTITGNVIVSGLPFTVENTTNQNFVGSVLWANTASSFVSLVAIALVNTTTAAIRGATAAATSNNTSLAAADIANNTTLIVTISYRASA